MSQHTSLAVVSSWHHRPKLGALGKVSLVLANMVKMMMSVMMLMNTIMLFAMILLVQIGR